MRQDSLTGGALAVTAFLLWGSIPIYFKAVATVPLLELLAHRVVWVVAFLGLILLLAGRVGAFLASLGDRRVLLSVAACALLLSINWCVFIWAIANDRVLETSLGYYINPLVNVILGLLVLRERLSRLQGLAVVLAAAGVLNLGLNAPGFPWVSLTLAMSFGVYGLVRKIAHLGSVEGLLAEVLLLLPVGLAYLLVLEAGESATFLAGGTWYATLIVLSGPVTALPLLAFVGAARRLNYATIGFFQYIAPTCHFLLAVFLYAEPFTRAHLWSFLCIWGALILYSLSALRARPERAAVGGPGR